jgi:cytoskeletal protein RodZ
LAFVISIKIDFLTAPFIAHDSTFVVSAVAVFVIVAAVTDLSVLGNHEEPKQVIRDLSINKTLSSKPSKATQSTQEKRLSSW